jgi:multidrug efflux pump subunit AcrA (membrane-fusion protein)
VAQGDTLFTVGSSDAFRLILDVDERDVGLIRTGQQVRVRMAALPERTWQAQVESVLPVAASSRQGNVFRVPAVLDLPGEVLRPGMEGVAKLDAGTGALGWVYTRRMRTTLQTWAWHLGLLR